MPENWALGFCPLPRPEPMLSNNDRIACRQKGTMKFLDTLLEFTYRLTWGVSGFLACLVTVAPDWAYVDPPVPRMAAAAHVVASTPGRTTTHTDTTTGLPGPLTVHCTLPRVHR